MKKTSFGSPSFVAGSCKPNITKYLCVGERRAPAESRNWSKQENFKFNFRKFYLYSLYFHEFSLVTNFVLWSFGRKIMPSKYFVKSLRGKIWHLFLKVWNLKILNKKFKHQKRWAQPNANMYKIRRDFGNYVIKSFVYSQLLQTLKRDSYKEEKLFWRSDWSETDGRRRAWSFGEQPQADLRG